MAATNTRVELRVLSENELESYMPPESFWILREMWCDHGTRMVPGRSTDSIHIVVLRIVFWSDRERSDGARFNNVDSKAELHNLVVRNDAGVQIQPVRHLHIRPKANARTPQATEPDSQFVCDIVGEVVGEWLIFPGARYLIPSNRKMTGVQPHFRASR